ncbi:MauE/DoxX family redox-associated membrane protein [Corallococcus sp. EGB]|uniref:MauE/DoxX family redox-associated membrane protein n=1 Tax=Corallococcus sp. EGB TaxID=1521117 RepID=UPI001CC0DF42|nr:MauE/DoxX family redox-associated membrane protein [Corallococcus sp. EGB]
MTVPSQPADNAGLAYALARVGLGLNIALHGLVRLPQLTAFAAGMRDSFDKSPLPPAWVYAVSLAIPVAEAVIGLLLFLGVEVRRVLVAGALLMLLLIGGACSAQNWNAASIQMTYLGFYVVLLATAHHDSRSVDAWRRARRAG